MLPAAVRPDVRVARLGKGWSHDEPIVWFTDHRHVTIMTDTKTAGERKRGAVGFGVQAILHSVANYKCPYIERGVLY